MDELQVYFCDLCNTSVPEQDLASGDAQRIHDKIIGACCLKELRAGSSPAAPAAIGDSAPKAGSSKGWFLAAFVMLIAVAGSTVFLEWRIAQESTTVGRTLRGARSDLDTIDERVVSVEKRLGSTLSEGALDPVQDRVKRVAAELTGVEERIVGSVSRNATRLRDIGTQIHALDSGQRDHVARIAELHGEMRRLTERVDDLIVAAARRPEPASTVPEEVSADPETVPPAPDALPPQLASFVAQLKDPDDGARFEAVDELLQSGDKRVFPHVLPLSKDPDPFVRRLVFEGLKDYRSPESVDVLVEALADSESLVRYTAHASLKSLTGQDFPFDPDAAAGKRAGMQRRWREWWGKNREGMFGA